MQEEASVNQSPISMRDTRLKNSTIIAQNNPIDNGGRKQNLWKGCSKLHITWHKTLAITAIRLDNT